MKKQLLLLSFFMIAIGNYSYVRAQTTYSETTPVTQLPVGVSYQGGPGASNTFGWAYPFGTKLTIQSQGGHRNLELLVDNKGPGQLRFRQYDMVTATWLPWKRIITQNGDAEIDGGFSLTGTNPISSVNGFQNVLQIKNTYNGAIVFNPGEATELMFGFNNNGNFYWGNGSTDTYPMILSKTGTARISNTLSVGGDGVSGYNLAVHGKAVAKEVKVTLDGWSDYVFEEDYALRPLTELATFIKRNKHLPGIPTEKEVLEEGVNMGEMNAKLLAKIEELTLYLISQEKELADLRELKKEVQALKKLFETNIKPDRQ